MDYVLNVWIMYLRQWLFFGSPKRWDRWHIIPQLAVCTTYIPLIVLAFCGVKNATDPTFYGNQKTTIDYMTCVSFR